MYKVLYIVVFILLLSCGCYFYSHIKSFSKNSDQSDTEENFPPTLDCGKFAQTTNNIRWKLYDKHKLPRCTQIFPDLRKTYFAPYKEFY